MRVTAPFSAQEIGTEPERRKTRLEPPNVAAVLALQRSAGNAAVAAMLRRPATALLQRQLPDSTQAWQDALTKIDAGNPTDWVKLLGSLDPAHTYAVKDGAVLVSDNLILHP